MGNICGGTVVVVHERDTETTNAIHEEALESKQSMITELEARLHSLQEQLARKDSRIQELKNNISEVESKNASLTAENESLKEDLSNHRKDSGYKIAELNRQLNELEASTSKKKESGERSDFNIPPFPLARPPSAHQTPKTLKKVGTAEIGFEDVYTPKSTTVFSESDLYDDPIAGDVDGFLDDSAITLDAPSGSTKQRWSTGTTSSAYVGFDNIYSAQSSLNFKESDLHYDAVAGIASPYEESSSGLGRGCNPVRNAANDENENAVNKRVKKTQKKRESAEVSYGDVYQQRDSSNTFGFAPNREHTF